MGELTDDDFAKMNGKREELSGKLQSSYGHTKEQAEKAIDDFLKKF